MITASCAGSCPSSIALKVKEKRRKINFKCLILNAEFSKLYVGFVHKLRNLSLGFVKQNRLYERFEIYGRIREKCGTLATSNPPSIQRISINVRSLFPIQKSRRKMRGNNFKLESHFQIN